MKRGFVTALMLLIATLLLVTLGFLPTSIEKYQDSGARLVGNALFAENIKVKHMGTCGKINGVQLNCDTNLVCSNGQCKFKVGDDCKVTSDCERGALCSTLNVGDKKMKLCLKPNA